MIYSVNKNFVFFHIWKTAGSSFDRILRKYNNNDCFGKLLNKIQVNQNILPDKYKYFDVHTTYIELNEMLKNGIPNDCFTFSIVRNPWDWHVSLFHYMRQKKTHYQHKMFSNVDSFESYLLWRTTYEPISQYPFISNNLGEIAVDYVGRFECLQNTVDLLNQKLDLGLSLPHVNKSSHRHYKEYYTDRKMVDLVYKINEKDIEMFGYEF